MRVQINDSLLHDHSGADGGVLRGGGKHSLALGSTWKSAAG